MDVSSRSLNTESFITPPRSCRLKEDAFVVSTTLGKGGEGVRDVKRSKISSNSLRLQTNLEC